MSIRFIIAGVALLAGTAASAGDALTLPQAQSLAIERNPDLRIARAALASARANVQSAGAPPNPVLSLSTSSIGVNGSGGGPLWRRQIDSVLGVSQLIERGGKRELRQENAEHQVRAAGADLGDVRRQLRMMVAQAYVDLHAAQDRVAVTHEAARLMDEMLGAAQIRREAGDIAGADVERVRVDALRARNELVAADGERSRARHALALLLAQSEQAEGLEAVDAWPAVAEASIATSLKIDDIIDHRADVQAAAARIDAAGAGTRLAESLRTRDVTVGAQLEHFPQPGDPSNPNGNSVGVSVQIPLFTRYYYQGEIGASLAALDAAKARYSQVRAVAETEIRTALAALQSAAERVRRNRDELLVAAEKAANAAEFAYRNGAVGVMDVLDARRTLRATRLDALAAQADFSKALANWKAATETNEDSAQ